MGTHELKYKSLLNELKYKNEELEIIEDSIVDIHLEFEEYYSNFLQENKLLKKQLEETRTKEFVEMVKADNASSKSTEVALVDPAEDEIEQPKVAFTKLYRQIVKKCHPDKLSQDNMDYFNKMNTKFKAATWAYNNGRWSILIRVAQELGIKPTNYKKINNHLKDEVKRVDNKIKNHKSTFGWMLFEAESKEEKDEVIKKFIYTLFRRVI